MLTISGLGVAPFSAMAAQQAPAFNALSVMANRTSAAVAAQQQPQAAQTPYAPAQQPTEPPAPLLCPDGITQVTNLAMCPTTAPQPTNTYGTPAMASSQTPTGYTCSDGITVVTDASMCPAAMAATAAASAAVANGSAGLAPTMAPSYTCPDGVTIVTDPSQCPQAAPAPGSSTGMQITSTAASAPAITAPSPIMPAAGMYLCPDGVTQTTDPTLASCPLANPTILGINQTTFLVGAALAVGLGAFLFLRK